MIKLHHVYIVACLLPFPILLVSFLVSRVTGSSAIDGLSSAMLLFPSFLLFAVGIWWMLRDKNTLAGGDEGILYLDELTASEKAVLRLYLKARVKVDCLNPADPAVQGLVKKGLLVRVDVDRTDFEWKAIAGRTKGWIVESTPQERDATGTLYGSFIMPDDVYSYLKRHSDCLE